MVSVKILDAIGFDAAIDRAVALLGIPENEIEERGFARVYPLGLGVCSVRPIEMARAFAIFANQGKEVEPIAIRTVEDRNGDIILNPERDLRLKQQQKGEDIQVISPQNAFIMTDILQKTVATGTLRRGAGYGSRFKYTDKNGKSYTLPAAGKTGTTNDNADGWFIGYTPQLTAGAWAGFEDMQVHFARTGDGGGAGAALPIWGYFMQMVRKDPSLHRYYSQEAFDAPVGFEVNLNCDGSEMVEGEEEPVVEQVVMEQQEFDDEKEIYGFD